MAEASGFTKRVRSLYGLPEGRRPASEHETVILRDRAEHKRGIVLGVLQQCFIFEDRMAERDGIELKIMQVCRGKRLADSSLLSIGDKTAKQRKSLRQLAVVESALFSDKAAVVLLLLIEESLMIGLLHRAERLVERSCADRIAKRRFDLSQGAETQRGHRIERCIIQRIRDRMTVEAGLPFIEIPVSGLPRRWDQAVGIDPCDKPIDDLTADRKQPTDKRKIIRKTEIFLHLNRKDRGKGWDRNRGSRLALANVYSSKA